MFPMLTGGRSCTYSETLAVSGAGGFFFDYAHPYLYVTDQGTSSNSILKIYDMSNPTGPVLKSTTSLPNGSGALHPYYKSGKLYIPYRVSKKLGIWDVSNTAAPSMLSETTVAFAPNGVAVIGSIACVVFNENFLQTKTAEAWDVSNPSSPSLSASYSASKLGYSVGTTSDHFVLSGQNNSSGATHVTMLRASDFALRDTATDAVALAGIAAGWLAVNSAGTIAYSTHCGDAAVSSWNISDPTNITLTQLATNILPSFSTFTCICVRESTNRMYVGRAGGGGLRIDIIDISNPASMTNVGNISTSGETVNDIAIIEDGCAGLAWGQGTGAAIHLLGTPPLS